MQQLGLIVLAALVVGVLAWTLIGNGPAVQRAAEVAAGGVAAAPPAVKTPSESTANEGQAAATEKEAVDAQAEPDEGAAAADEDQDGAGAQAADAEATPVVSSDGSILVGELPFSKYLNSRELTALGIKDRDLSQTKYRANLDLNFLMSGGPPPDGIPSIDEPRFVTPEVADAWLTDEALVIGFQYDGITRAYPVGILNFHEIVNDTFNGTRVSITFCPLCNSSVAFLAPEIDGEFTTFGTSGRLYLSDLVMYDRATATFWSQLEGRPIVGPLLGVIDSLQRLPIDIMPYGPWKQAHPDTEVLARPREGDRVGRRIASGGMGKEKFLRDYTRDPYPSYKKRNPEKGGKTQFGIPVDDVRLKAKDGVVGVVVNGQPKAYAQAATLERKLLNDVVGDVPLLVVATPAGGLKFFERNVADSTLVFSLNDKGQLTDDQGNAWGFDGVATSGDLQGTQLKEIVATTSFWFAWISFNPTTELYTGDDQEQK